MTTTKLFVTALVATGLLAVPVATLFARSPQSGGGRPGTVAVAPLSEQEIATLRWMREEEKVARDLYLELNLYWPARVFTNIAASEQNHFDAIGKKLVLYGVADPALPDVGMFSSPELQLLHDTLLAQGMVSYEAALGAGVAIEEADIADLEAAIEGTASKPLSTTYQHLLNGSERHLRSFMKLLARLEID